MLLIAAGYPWSNWEEPVVTMKYLKRLEADYIHFKVVLKFVIRIVGTFVDKTFLS